MPFRIVRNDITKVKADAIVNTANPKPVIGRGTDSAVYKAAGEELLLEARRKIGDIAPGEAVHTPAFMLEAKYIIHTVGPVWEDGSHGECETLEACYRNSLNLAAELSCESIAFPLIAAGIYGFPKDKALQIALAQISSFLMDHEMNVTLVVFDRKAFELSSKLLGDIEEYIDEHDADKLREKEYGTGRGYESEIAEERRGRARDLIRRKPRPEPERDIPDPPEGQSKAAAVLKTEAETVFPYVSGKSLDEVLNNTGDTFQQRLFRLIDASGMDDVTVYKKANIDRKVFSKIRCNENYKPLKKTAVAFAIALRLDMTEMLDLLSRAGIAFSPSSKFDLIVSYFVSNKVYDVYKINAALFRYDQQLLD